MKKSLIAKPTPKHHLKLDNNNSSEQRQQYHKGHLCDISRIFTSLWLPMPLNGPEPSLELSTKTMNCWQKWIITRLLS